MMTLTPLLIRSTAIPHPTSLHVPASTAVLPSNLLLLTGLCWGCKAGGETSWGEKRKKRIAAVTNTVAKNRDRRVRIKVLLKANSVPEVIKIPEFEVVQSLLQIKPKY